MLPAPPEVDEAIGDDEDGKDDDAEDVDEEEVAGDVDEPPPAADDVVAAPPDCVVLLFNGLALINSAALGFLFNNDTTLMRSSPVTISFGLRFCIGNLNHRVRE